MKILFCFIFSAALIAVCFARAAPESPEPNSEYELISGGPQVVPKAAQVPEMAPMTTTTQTPRVINTPPPVDPNTKSFAYDPKTQTWTLVKKNDPQPDAGTLVFNQSNDKWLTNIPRF